MKGRKGLKVLLVEDERLGGGLLKRELKRSGYDSTNLVKTISRKDDLGILLKEPYDLVLLGYPLDGAKAIDILKRVREMNLDISVTMITGKESARVALKTMESGFYDYAWKSDLVSARDAAAILGVTVQTIKNYIHSGRLETHRTPGGRHRIRWEDISRLGGLEEGPFKTDLYQGYIDTLQAVTNALDARDGNQSGHSRRVMEIVISLTEIVGISGKEQEIIKVAALLHDLGKIMISEHILSKPGKLTDQERYLVQQHPELGEVMVNGVRFLQDTKSLIRHHHERFDGTGYPDGISGQEIPLGARMIFLAGAFDCITHECTYHPKRCVEDAVSEIEQYAGTQFDPEIARIFLENRDQVVQGISGVT